MVVYFYSRSGRSEAIARDIGKSMKIEVRKIRDNENWKGPINFLKAGAAASKKQTTRIDCEPPEEDTTVILVFPVWAGTFPPAVRSFIKTYNRLEIIAVPTSLGTALRERDYFVKIIDLIGKDIVAPLNGQIL
ncbi:MAG: flavodoxin [Clostridia bacterium]